MRVRFLNGFGGAWESGHGQIHCEHSISYRHHISVRMLACFVLCHWYEGITDLDFMANLRIVTLPKSGPKCKATI